MMREYKLIDWRLFNPCNSVFGGKNDKASFTTLMCNNSENCDAFKQGRCVVWNGFGVRCPYGKKHKEEGFTRRARKFQAWIAERKDRVKDIPQLKGQKTFCKIGEHVFIPYSHWTLCPNIQGVKKVGLFSSGDKFIPIRRFTSEFFQKLVTGKPQAIMGGEITSYQKEVVPKMVYHLEENIPKLFNQWVLEYPDTAKRFEEKDYVGRKALVRTLKKDCVIKHKKGIMVWDGQQITVTGYKDVFFPVSFEEGILTIIPKEGAEIEITSNNQVCSTTKFVN